MSQRARMHRLLDNPQSGADIEAQSFATIDREASSHAFSTSQWEVVRRMIHTTGDFSLMESVRFSDNALGVGVEALQAGSPLFVDANMIRSGISLPRLKSAWAGYGAGHIVCHVADEDVSREAQRAGLPRSLLAVRKAKPQLAGAIAVFGNSPTALMELCRI